MGAVAGVKVCSCHSVGFKSLLAPDEHYFLLENCLGCQVALSFCSKEKQSRRKHHAKPYANSYPFFKARSSMPFFMKPSLRAWGSDRVSRLC